MDIAEFNVRCYVCWKQFRIPSLSDFSYGEFLFMNYKTREFRYFNRIENRDVESIINEKLNSEFSLKLKNDTTKQHTALKLIGKLSDGEFEPIFSQIKCPRCNIGFHSVPNKRSGMKNIAELTFEISKKKTIIENSKDLKL